MKRNWKMKPETIAQRARLHRVERLLRRHSAFRRYRDLAAREAGAPADELIFTDTFERMRALGDNPARYALAMERQP